MTTQVYPTAWLRCMKAEDRASLGKAGLLPEECAAKVEAKNERQLQGQIVQYLRLHNIEACWHRTDKKSAATIGWPDITFAASAKIHHGYINSGSQETFKREPIFIPCAWEIKFGPGQLSKEQEQMAIRLQSSPNCWRYRVIRSFDEAVAELKEMGVAQ